LATPDQDSHPAVRYGEPLAADGCESPAAERNKEPILAVLRRVLPPAGTVLEVASGTGQHAVHFARGLPDLIWQPSEPDPDLRASITARVAAAGLPNLRQPLALDVLEPDWPIAHADAIVCINLIHIAPWPATEALFAHAGRLLAPPAVVVLYGPYRRRSVPTAPSNEAFDASLRRRNPAWGLRDLEAVEAVAATNGFAPPEVFEMPANNLSVVLRRSAGGPSSMR
jgi:SAM-dependent methyltransferase